MSVIPANTPSPVPGSFASADPKAPVVSGGGTAPASKTAGSQAFLVRLGQMMMSVVDASVIGRGLATPSNGTPVQTAVAPSPAAPAPVTKGTSDVDAAKGSDDADKRERLMDKLTKAFPDRMKNVAPEKLDALLDDYAEGKLSPSAAMDKLDGGVTANATSTTAPAETKPEAQRPTSSTPAPTTPVAEPEATPPVVEELPPRHEPFVTSEGMTLVDSHEPAPYANGSYEDGTR